MVRSRISYAPTDSILLRAEFVMLRPLLAIKKFMCMLGVVAVANIAAEVLHIESTIYILPVRNFDFS